MILLGQQPDRLAVSGGIRPYKGHVTAAMFLAY